MENEKFHLSYRSFWSIVPGIILLLAFSNCSDKSNPTEPDPAPTVSLTAPANGDTLSGSIQIIASTANATLVYFYCDGIQFGEDNSSPYSLSWNSTSVSDGTHTLKVKAEGSGGSAEAQIQVVVQNNQTGVVVAVIPATATLQLGQTQQFTAQVTGTNNTSVNWTVTEGNGWGTINSTGLYTAPTVLPSPAVATIRATSVADPTKSATASVTLTGTTNVVVAVTPNTATVQVGQTQQFTAQVTGTSNISVNWTVIEGSSYGTINSTGLYTAPAVLPSPAAATIRVTSVADPTKSATASVTLTGTGGVTPEITALCQATFNAGYEVGDLGDESVNLAAEAVWGASELNGGNLTLTGTLTQTAQGSDVWTYSTNPSNKLVIAFAGGPTVEMVFTQFNGYMSGTWEEFLDQHTIDFTIFIAGQVNLRIQSQSGFVMGSPFPKSPTRVPEWDREWQRILTGSTLYEGEMLTINITHHGNENGFVEPGWSYLAHDETYTGTANSATRQMTISQTSYTSRMHNSNTANHVLNGQLTNNSSATMNGVTYQFNNAHAAWAAGSTINEPTAFNVVIDPNYWVAQGNMTKDGLLFGNIQFTGPVVANEYGGPDLVLHLTTGEDIFLHTLVIWP